MLDADALRYLHADLIEQGEVFIRRENREQVRAYLTARKEQFWISWETDNMLKIERVRASP